MEEQRRQQDQEQRKKQSMLMAQNEPIRGLGGFQQAFGSNGQDGGS